MTRVTLGQPNNPYTARVGSVQGLIDGIYTYLEGSEWLLIDIMINDKKWIGPDPSGSGSGGDIEYGVFLYLLNNPNKITNQDLSLSIAALVLGLDIAGYPVPATQMTSANYSALQTDDLTGPDGSILGTAPYETYDQNWLFALRNMLECVLRGYIYTKNGGFPVPPADTVPALVGQQTGIVTVGLLSDWGTGDQTASDVMTALTARNPDCIVHLGDVYYSGTPNTALSSQYDLKLANEEIGNLIELWPKNFSDKSFTLNSNHEMYSGALGYFEDALGAPSTPFVLQGGCSMFARRVGDWTLLGLDSAYFSDPISLYMYGNLDDTQVAWAAGLQLDAAKTIILTHHTGFDYNCAPASQANYAAFWLQIKTIFGGKDPYAWYWGHVHNGIVYDKPVNITSDGSAFVTQTYCRCLGHGALPFGKATGLVTGSDNVRWFVEEVENGLALNGYVTLEFAVDETNTCQSITERYFSKVLSAAPCFENKLYPPSGS